MSDGLSPRRAHLGEMALQIWRAGVDAANAERLVRSQIQFDPQTSELQVVDQTIRLEHGGRLCVVGGGKAGAAMAAGVEAALTEQFLDRRVDGWVNVPANCLRPLRRIHLHAARPQGANEATESGIAGTEEILRRVARLKAEDICLVLISGGGSALLPAPVPGIALADKVLVTRWLSEAGATIEELNSVRRLISRVKAGGLARACRAGKLIALVISDVIGDPLPVIASGPTVIDPADPADGLRTLLKYDPQRNRIPEAIWLQVERAARGEAPPPAATAQVWNRVIGNNCLAVQACAAEAKRQGLSDVRVLGWDLPGDANRTGRDLAQQCLAAREDLRTAGRSGRMATCLISGGEPTVRLAATSVPRRGGRNQELALAAAEELWTDGAEGIVILSGGTDGEDGPTDAAGAVVDAQLIARAKSQSLAPDPYLEINNSYAFFKQCGGLLITGPTHTNVMDIRVAMVADH